MYNHPMPRGQTFVTIILTTSLLILAVSANSRNHILHVNHVDATNADANPNDKSHDIANAAHHIGKAINGIANAANSLVNNLASVLKPNKDNFTEYPRPALVQEFVMAHNEIRRSENIKPLVWNDTMAQLAEDWAKKQDHDCGMRHSSYHGMGENLFWGYKAHWLPREAVYDWATEKQYYNKEKRQCEPDKTCDHYTQVIWKDTEQVGCARHKCSNGSLLVVCEYYPPGNWAGMDPYNPIPLSQLAHYNLSTTAPSPPSSSNSHTSPPPPPKQSSNSHTSPPSSPPPPPSSNSHTSPPPQPKQSSNSHTSPPSSPPPPPSSNSHTSPPSSPPPRQSSNSHTSRPSSPPPPLSSNSHTSPPTSPPPLPSSNSHTSPSLSPPPPPSSNLHASPPSSPPPSSNSHTSPPSSSQPTSPPHFGEASASSSNTLMKRKGNKGAGHHVPRGQNRRHGQNRRGQGHHVPRQGNQGPINHGQGQRPRRGGHRRQPQPQSQTPPLVVKQESIQH